MLSVEISKFDIFRREQVKVINLEMNKSLLSLVDSNCFFF